MLAVAALSARALVDLAALDGMAVVALDVFGDADTVKRAAHWHPIGTPGRLEIDGTRLLAALEALARDGDVDGWIAGAGFDGRPGLLEAGAERLPLLGTGGGALRRLRDPRAFFAALDDLGLPHPAVSFEPPADPAGWLEKDAGGSGGWHVQEAAPDRPAAPGRYWQRWRPGLPMSATLVANGHDAVVLGFNLQTVRPVAGRRWVFAGIVGPLPVPPAVERTIVRAASVLARRFDLHGLASLDFLLDGEHAELLELNARPPASAELYPEVGRGGALRAHLRAVTRAELPPPPPPPPRVMNGHEIVFARRALVLDDIAAARIAATPLARDWPRGGQRFDVGDPVCSLAAAGADAAEVLAALATRREALLAFLENR